MKKHGREETWHCVCQGTRVVGSDLAQKIKGAASLKSLGTCLRLLEMLHFSVFIFFELFPQSVSQLWKTTNSKFYIRRKLPVIFYEDQSMCVPPALMYNGGKERNIILNFECFSWKKRKGLLHTALLVDAPSYQFGFSSKNEQLSFPIKTGKLLRWVSTKSLYMGNAYLVKSALRETQMLPEHGHLPWHVRPFSQIHKRCRAVKLYACNYSTEIILHPELRFSLQGDDLQNASKRKIHCVVGHKLTRIYAILWMSMRLTFSVYI